jgi:hypothetical protein
VAAELDDAAVLWFASLVQKEKQIHIRATQAYILSQPQQNQTEAIRALTIGTGRGGDDGNDTVGWVAATAASVRYSTSGARFLVCSSTPPRVGRPKGHNPTSAPPPTSCG